MCRCFAAKHHRLTSSFRMVQISISYFPDVAGKRAKAAVSIVAKAAGLSLTALAAPQTAPAAGPQHAVGQANPPAAPAATAQTAADGKNEDVSGAATGSDATATEVAGVRTMAQKQLLIRKNRTKSASQAPVMRVRLASKSATGRG